jgi:AhpD family alkylhydroperoxidase
MSQRLDYPHISPAGARALGGVHQYVMASGLSPALINLVYLRISQINGCAYCIAMHSLDLLNGNTSIEKMMMLSTWRETEGIFSDEECAALQWAESVTNVYETGAADTDYRAAEAHFNPKELVDLTIAISLMNAYNRLAIGFRRTPKRIDTE